MQTNGADNPFTSDELATLATQDGKVTTRDGDYRLLISTTPAGTTSVIALPLDGFNAAVADFRRALLVGGLVDDVITGDMVIHEANGSVGLVECDSISFADGSPIPPLVNCPTGHLRATGDLDFDFRSTSLIEVLGENARVEAEWEEWVEQPTGEWVVERSGVEVLGPGKHEYLSTDLPNDRFQRLTIHPWPGTVVMLAENGAGPGASATLTYVAE